MTTRLPSPTTSFETLPFEQFWRWVQAHADCIVQAGTPDVTLYDDEAFHWRLSTLEPGLHLVHLMSGKRIVAELELRESAITYVQMEPIENDEHRFELVSETETGRFVPYHFVMAHGYETEMPTPEDTWVN